MKIKNDDMKKLEFGFRNLFALAIGTILAFGCQKTEVPGGVQAPEEESPVEIKLSVGKPLSVVTKAAVDKWDNSEVNVFGLRRLPGAVVGQKAYEFTSTYNIVDYPAIAAEGEKDDLEVYSNEEKKIPYFYSEGYVYDFYGYHLGGATSANVKIEDDSYSFDVTFEGYNDVMYAATDKAKDIEASGSTETINETDVYSAWAARRLVQPTLVFNHALTRLNFIIQGRGANKKYQYVRITGIEVKGINKGKLTVTGPNIGFEKDAAASLVDFQLRSAADATLTPFIVDENTSGSYAGGDGACIMVAPGLEQVEMTIHMEDVRYNIPIEDYKYTVNAKDVVREDGANVTSFDAGLSYDFFVYVYGPEEINVSAKVTPWEKGGTTVIDPDSHGPSWVASDPIIGCYSFTPVGGMLDNTHPYVSSQLVIGGVEPHIVYFQIMDKFWLWNSTYYWPMDEDDNVLSFSHDWTDQQAGISYGTIVNTPGPDAKYADFHFLLDYRAEDHLAPENLADVNSSYRLIPAGKSRWSRGGDGVVYIYSYDDNAYETPLHALELLEAGDHVFWADALNSNGESAAKTVTVPSLALHRSFDGPFDNDVDDWSDARFYVNNIRNVFWLIQKDSDSPLANHKELLEN